MNLLLLYRIKCLPKNTNGRLAIPALAGLLVLISPLNDLSYDCTRRTLFVLLLQLCSVHKQLQLLVLFVVGLLLLCLHMCFYVQAK